MAAALRDAGHDVLAVAAVAKGAPDALVLDLARNDQRIALTEDRDFGRLVFAQDPPLVAGVVYIRCPEWARCTLPVRIVDLVARHTAQLERSFVVWTPRRVRIRALGGR